MLADPTYNPKGSVLLSLDASLADCRIHVFRGGLHFSRIKTMCIQCTQSTVYPVINIQQDSLSVRDPVTPSSVQDDSSLINNSILSTRVFRIQNVCIMYVENPGKYDRHRSHSWAEWSIPVTHGGQHNTINIHMIQVIKTDRLFIISLWVINRAREGWKNNGGCKLFSLYNIFSPPFFHFYNRRYMKTLFFSANDTFNSFHHQFGDYTN